MARKDYYKILGVDSDATKEEIKKAYHKMAIKFHPDKNPDDKQSEEKFKEAAEAYDVLSNPNKKTTYDRGGHFDIFGGFGQGGVNFDDIFGGFSQGSRPKQRPPKRGASLRMTVAVSLEDVFNGAKREMKYKRKAKCKTCGGTGSKNKDMEPCHRCSSTGRIIQEKRTALGLMRMATDCPDCDGVGRKSKKDCPECNGTAVVDELVTEEVNIPKGVYEGLEFLIIKKGSEASGVGGASGDLLIHIKEEPHHIFKRNGGDLVCECYISFVEAIEGAQITIPGIDENYKIAVEAGTPSGKILRLRKKGFPIYGLPLRGDLLVRINVYIPTELNGESKKIIEKLKKGEQFIPKERFKKDGNNSN